MLCFLFIWSLLYFRSETSDKAFVSNLSRHKGPVSLIYIENFLSISLFALIYLFLSHYVVFDSWWLAHAVQCIYFQVRGLEFNSITPNLLASGADEGDICIWDVAKPSEPSHFPPLKVFSFSIAAFLKLLHDPKNENACV